MTLGCVISYYSLFLIRYCRRCASKRKEVLTLNTEEMMLTDNLREVSSQDWVTAVESETWHEEREE